MKIKLIAPNDGAENSTSSSETFKIQRLSLPILAAVTPEHHDVILVDEAFSPDNQDSNFDLVGISVLTDLVTRAYSLADYYRKKGVYVVLGGMHPTVLPEEALGHADSVVMGEAEDVWLKLLKDFESGNPQKIYRALKPVSMDNSATPRRDLYSSPNSKGYTPLTYSIEASRGCPYDCEFCSIQQVMGKSYRMRPVDDVINEIRSLDSENLFFVDDSFGLKSNSTKLLLEKMIPFKRMWVGQGTVSLASDIEMLQLMQRSGCKGLLIGFESIQEDAQKTLKKVSSSKIDYADAVKRFHDHGIAILGGFVFGFDNETKDVFEQTEKFIKDYKLEAAQLRILTPFPGTVLYKRLFDEGRLIEPEWWLKGYKSADVLYRPSRMSVEDLWNGLAELKKSVYSYRSIIERYFGMRLLSRKSMGNKIYWGLNLATRKRYLMDLEKSI